MVTHDVKDIYVEAWVEPRKSIQRVQGFGLTERDRLLMVIVNLVVTAISIALMIRTMPGSQFSEFISAAPVLVRYASYVIFVFGSYWFGSFLLKTIGTACGGTASAETCRDVIAWWMLVTAIVTLIESILPLVLPAGLVALISLAAMVGGVIIFAAYTAEVHGFKSVPQVAGATVAVGIGLLLVANFFLLSLMPA